MEESTESIDTNNEFNNFDFFNIFSNADNLISFLKQNNGIKNEIICSYCNTVTMKLLKDRSRSNGFIYKCKNDHCRRKVSILISFRYTMPRIPITKLFLCAYLFSLKLTNYQVVIMANISETVYIKLKDYFINALERSQNNKEKLVGEGYILKIEETACNMRRLITSLTTEEEFVRDTKWVIGIICERTREKRLEVLDDRTVGSITSFLQRNVKENSIIKSDGYPSYPRSILAVNCLHQVVNHSHGFVSGDGTHTNIIENMWAHLKTDLRTRRGVMFSNLNKFIMEWSIYTNIVKKKTKAEIMKLFFAIIKNL